MKPKIITLQHLLEKGIHYENQKDFSASIYANVYQGAFESVKQIMTDYERHRNVKGRNMEIANVVSFVGRRGTGKSSSMMSFLEALQNYKWKPDGKESEKKLGDSQFFTLECIDASALEEDESIFTIVLANMLSKIDEYSKDKEYDLKEYQRRSLQMKLEKIYKNYCSLTEVRALEQGEYSAYENLKNLASSQRIRTQFEELVKECLQYFSAQDGYSAQKTYLVIAVDDLDMAHYNKRKGKQGHLNIRSYEIMRLISKYFSVPKVIVLTAYNHASLYGQCSGFFTGSNTSNYNEVYESKESLGFGARLATEFMEKVFAPVYRLYMPSWKKWDYNGRNIKVDVGETDRPEDIFFRFYKEKNKHIFSVKKLLLVIYAERTGIYYDCEGKKRHFLEPDSLRDLSNILHLLLEEEVQGYNGQELYLPKKGGEMGEGFKRIMDDSYFRFIQERIYLEEERELLYSLLENQITRRGEQIIRLISPEIKPLGRSGRQISKLLKSERKEFFQYTSEDFYGPSSLESLIDWWEDNSDVSYSYAELVHSIYHMTRLEAPYSRGLVECILQFFSISLAQIYYAYEDLKRQLVRIEEEEEQEEGWIYINTYRKWGLGQADSFTENSNGAEVMGEIEKYNQLLKGFIGDTVLGKWTEYYFPKVYMSGITEKYSVVIGCFDGIWEAEFKVVSLFEHDPTKDDIKNMIEECVFLMMMYPDLLKWKKLQLEIRHKADGDGIRGIEIFHNGEVRFELSAFITCSIFYPYYLGKIEQLLLDSFQEGVGDNSSEKAFKKDTKGMISVVFNGLWQQYYGWDKKYGNMILPIQHFDTMYNLIKHLFQEGKAANEYAVNLDEKGVFFREFCLMADNFGKHLKKMDDYYCLKDERSFLNKFEKCPYFGLLKNVGSKEYIEDYIKNIAISVYNHRMMGFSPDDKKGMDGVGDA
ncbi:MAG: hypothetical protein HFH38_03695 [Lachnospiraceae bacterium]|jgi:hypothetical protein|nr:hypothetical protein [Lachnospiraceae bacterium]